VTFDVVALCEQQPDAGSTLAALQACGPALRVGMIERGSLVQLRDDRDRPLVTIEGPRLVQAPGEVERVLGVPVAGPVWWVEARAVPEGAEVARRFAAALLSQTGGASWSSR
jgi:hypothetical protein